MNPAVSTQPFNPTAMSRSDWRPTVHSPEQLRLHPALEELGWAGEMDEFNDAASQKHEVVPEPILIAASRIILAGFGRWRAAVLGGRHEIHCVEYPLDEDEALHFIIRHHQPHSAWNAFTRVRLALKLEPYFQKKALDNMRTGGKYKGSANLPEAQHIEVRQEIARESRVGARTVSNVKMILQTAHSRLIEALQDGSLTINRAIHFCKLRRAEQLEQFIRDSEERAINKVIGQSIARLNKDKPSPDAVSVLETLKQKEAQQPGSVTVRFGRQQRTVVVVGQDLKHQCCQKGMDLT
jgi:hypothetical protein